MVNHIDKVETSISSSKENHQDLQDKMNKIEDHKDIQDTKLENLEVQLQKIAKLNYNNPWLDQSNQNIPMQDNDYKTFPLLKSYKKDHHFNKFKENLKDICLTGDSITSLSSFWNNINIAITGTLRTDPDKGIKSFKDLDTDYHPKHTLLPDPSHHKYHEVKSAYNQYSTVLCEHLKSPQIIQENQAPKSYHQLQVNLLEEDGFTILRNIIYKQCAHLGGTHKDLHEYARSLTLANNEPLIDFHTRALKMFNEIMLSKDETGQGNQLIKQYINQLDNITDFKPHVFEFKRAISRFFRQPNNHKRCFEYSLQEIYESFEETGAPKIITIQPSIENEQAIVASANTESDNTHENPIINAMPGKDIQLAGYQRRRQNNNNFKPKQRNNNYIPLSSKICECCGNSNKMLVKKLHVLHPPDDPTKCMFRGTNYIQDNQIRQRVRQYNIKNPTKPILKNTKALPNSPPDQPILPQVNTGTFQNNNDNNEFDGEIYISDEEEQTEPMCNGLNNSYDIFNDTIEEINDDLGQLPTPTMNTSQSEFIDSMEQWQDAQE